MAGFVHGRAQALPRQFKQAETRDATDLYAGAVNFGRLVEAGFHVFTVAVDPHVDEIDNDKTAKVTQAHLARNFICRFKVGLVGSFFDVATFGRFRRVDVDGNERFGVVNDEFATGWQLYVALVSGFYLPFDLVAGKEWDVVLVEFEFVEVVRHDQGHEITGLLIDTFVVNEDLPDIRTQIVAQGADDDVTFLVDKALQRGFAVFFRDGFPQLQQEVEIPLQFFLGAPHPGSTHDDAHIVRHVKQVKGFAQFFAVISLNAT